MENKKKYKYLRWILLGIVFLCLIRLGQAYFQSVRQHRQQEDLIQSKQFTEETDRDNKQETEHLEETDGEKAEPVILKKYRKLYKANHDMAGWITVKGTNIDYPVMQCDDNEYYLYHDFYREKSKYGCLYVKEEADLAEGTNFIIYGHNMRDGSMFGDLDRYLQKDFYRKHPTISFDTLYEERMYEIVAVFRSQVYKKEDDVFKYYQFYQADTKKQFDDFYRNIKKLSLYDTGVKAEFGDVFLTLSTCAYHVEDGRFVVVAKRKK